MALDPFAACGLVASIVSFADLFQSLFRQYRDAANEFSQLSGEFIRLSRALDNLDICSIERLENIAPVASSIQRDFSGSSICSGAWTRVHAHINALQAARPRRWDNLGEDLQAQGVRQFQFPPGPHLSSSSRSQRDPRRLLFITQLCDAPLLVEALLEIFPREADFRENVAAIVVLDETSQRNPVPTSAESMELIVKLHKMEEKLSSFAPGDEKTTVKTVLIKERAPCEQLAANDAMRSKFRTQYVLSHTTIYQCPAEEIFDCTLWSVREVADKLAEMDCPLQRNVCPPNVSNPCSTQSSQLRHLLHGRSHSEILITIEACQWVACTFRCLQVSELVQAVKASSKLVRRHEILVVGSQEGAITRTQVLSLCTGVLNVEQDDTVCFRDDGMRSLFLSSEDSLLSHVVGCHEMVTNTCLNYLHHTARSAVFKPWAEFANFDDYSQSFLKRYATSHWYQHYRLAEPHSEHLPGLLRSIIASMFPVNAATPIRGHGFYSQRNDIGLELCVKHGFPVLGAIYISMGANPNSFGTMTNEPLLFQAAASRPDMVEILLQGGADVHKQDSQGITALHLAVARGYQSAASALLCGHVPIEAVPSPYVLSPRIEQMAQPFKAYDDTTDRTRHLSEVYARLSVSTPRLQPTCVDCKTMDDSISQSGFSAVPASSWDLPGRKRCSEFIDDQDRSLRTRQLMDVAPNSWKRNCGEQSPCDCTFLRRSSNSLNDWVWIEIEAENFM